MASRFTETEKWNDAWFSGLKPLSKLLFLYLCDQCDIAGFLEINERKICFDLGIGKQEVEKGLKEVETRLIYSKHKRFVFVINFLKHQKNQKLNPTNNAHKGIIKRLEDNLLLFGFKDISQFTTSPSLAPKEGLSRGTGKGNGNKDKGGMGEKEHTVKFAEFVRMTNDEYSSLITKLGNEEYVKRCIEILDNYKGSNGKKYKSDYRAILNWVIDKLKKEQSENEQIQQKTTTSFDGLRIIGQGSASSR